MRSAWFHVGVRVRGVRLSFTRLVFFVLRMPPTGHVWWFALALWCLVQAVPRTWNPTPKDNQILYCIRLHASSAKFSIDPDTSLQDEIQSLKSRWSKPEDKPEVPVKGKVPPFPRALASLRQGMPWGKRPRRGGTRALRLPLGKRLQSIEAAGGL